MIRSAVSALSFLFNFVMRIYFQFCYAIVEPKEALKVHSQIWMCGYF